MNIRRTEITGRHAKEIRDFLNSGAMDSLVSCLNWHEACALVDAAEKMAGLLPSSGVPSCAATPLDTAMRMRVTKQTLEKIASGDITLETGTITP